MTSDDIFNVLSLFLNKIAGEDITWRLEGSTNLKVQGIDVGVNDLDILVDSRDFSAVCSLLNPYFIEVSKPDINVISSIYGINGQEVEVLLRDDERLNMFDKVSHIIWRGLDLPVLPLEHARRFYECIDRPKKVAIIDSYLQGRG